VEDLLELGRVTDRRPPFKYSALARVWFSDTDAQGVVYYGRYLPYFDHARTEYHRHLLIAPFCRPAAISPRARCKSILRAGSFRRSDRGVYPNHGSATSRPVNVPRTASLTTCPW
jgi:hypothetical protein